MHVQLYCPRCSLPFEVPNDSPELARLNRLAEEGPWSVLGDGETLEDSLHAALDAKVGPACPECGQSVPIPEEVLGQMTLELLGHW
jgi:hypothetical protein